MKGILFSFMMDYLVGYDAEETEIWRYGGDNAQQDERAKKVANNCLKGVNMIVMMLTIAISCIYNCQVPGICYPLLVVIEYRGLTLLAQSVVSRSSYHPVNIHRQIPIEKLVYGSSTRSNGTVEIG